MHKNCEKGDGHVRPIVQVRLKREGFVKHLKEEPLKWCVHVHYSGEEFLKKGLLLIRGLGFGSILVHLFMRNVT